MYGNTIAALVLLSMGLACAHRSDVEPILPVAKAAPEEKTAVSRITAASPATDSTAGRSSRPLHLPPLRVFARFAIDFEHGCSQSFESRGFSGTMILDIDADGDAIFSVEYEESMVFGPSLGRFRQGDTEFTHTRSRHRMSWTGRAHPESGSLLIEFDRLSATGVDLPGYGDAELPAPTTTSSSFHLRCAVSKVAAYPAPGDDGIPFPADGEEATETECLGCVASEDLFDLVDKLHVDDGLLMGFGDGLLVSSSTIFRNTGQVVRLAPPP